LVEGIASDKWRLLGYPKGRLNFDAFWGISQFCFRAELLGGEYEKEYFDAYLDSCPTFVVHIWMCIYQQDHAIMGGKSPIRSDSKLGATTTGYG
jgi:hypothetical protein